MNYFPLFDPIPLPAPVWLFKSLHILTLALHFVAVKILLGGLLAATVLNYFGLSNNLYRGASAALARRLPIIMTYVINLGVPPLLFSQVLYGPALYTSNVLIGLYWIAIVFLLMACYWMLYQFADGALEGKRVWWKGLLAWILAGCISRIFSTNMALMLKPEVWNEMYSSSALGAYLPPYDPTLLPRWLFMLSGGFAVAGLWMVWIAGRRSVEPPLNKFLSGLGGRLTVFMVIVQAFQFHFVLKAQPSVVIEGLSGSIFLNTAMDSWYLIAGLVLVFSLWVSIKKPCSYAAGYIAVLLVLLLVAAWTIVRDGIRDLTLASKGFDVWNQHVVANWSVIWIFFLSFGLGIASLVWLISVMMKAKLVKEGELS
ncbi:MAG: hypothetical protein KBD53_10935 [Candidatus Omnitrophica bacterium]|nr:hypothetical protein [Candidatus Omnitrophota bacterium]